MFRIIIKYSSCSLDMNRIMIKYSSCSLDMYSMILKIFFMFSRYIQIYLLYLFLHSSYRVGLLGDLCFFYHLTLTFGLTIWPYHLALPFGLSIWPYPNIFYVFLSIAPWNGDIQKGLLWFLRKVDKFRYINFSILFSLHDK